MIERQSDLSLDDVLNFLTNGGPYRRCMLLNELGIICQNGEDQNGAGEDYLIATLSEKNEGSRAIAFCCLALIPGAPEKYATVFADFRTKPENQELLSFIDESLARQQNEC